MKWIEAKVAYHHPDPYLASDLIANIFHDFELRGVVIEDPDLEPDNGWGEDDVARPGGYAVIGYFLKDSRTETKCKKLVDMIGQLKKTLGLTYRISYKELDDEDWAEAWKAYFWPQRIGRHMVVKPTWRDYQAGPDDIVVELDPGMAFGTGTHPTTALCIEMMEAYLKDGDSFLDLGTGSGILMIAAAKLGAGMVCGIDKDDLAVDIAQKNLRLNKIDRKFFSVHIGHLAEGIEKKYDFIAANILTHVILDLLDDIQRVIREKGVFVCSGILDENKYLVVAKMKEKGFEILASATREQWAAICGRFKVKGSTFRVQG